MGLSVPTLGLYTCIWPFFLNIFSQTAWSIKAKFHVEPSLEEGNNYIACLGHMNKKVAMPIYGKIFKVFSKNRILMILKIGMEHRVLYDTKFI